MLRSYLAPGVSDPSKRLSVGADMISPYRDPQWMADSRDTTTTSILQCLKSWHTGRESASASSNSTPGCRQIACASSNVGSKAIGRCHNQDRW